MIELKIWLVYGAIVGISYLIMIAIPETTKGVLGIIKTLAGFSFVFVGITFVAITAVLLLQMLAPYLPKWSSGTGNGSYEEQCVPDPWGGC